MRKLFRIQTDLFVMLTRPVELTGAERQKAVALLRALLSEALITRAGDPAEDETILVHDAASGERMPARLVVLALPPEQAEAARRVARKKARKWGHTASRKILATTGCVILIASLPREAWAGSCILELYRRRWQVNSSSND